jgi:hypothetical protein
MAGGQGGHRMRISLWSVSALRQRDHVLIIDYAFGNLGLLDQALFPVPLNFAVLGTSRLRMPNNRLDGGLLRAYYLP